MPPEPKKPGQGLLGWLGRQIGHVRHAVKTPVGQKTIYKTQKTETHPHPTDPAVTLKRTTIDEAIQLPPKKSRQDSKK